MAKPLQLMDTNTATATASSTPRIVATRGVGAPVAYDVTPDTTIIVGNSPTCGILVDDPNVGPIQCMIANHGSELEIQPWPTANGTQLNGGEVTVRTLLNNGDVISIGDCVLKIEGVSGGGGSNAAQDVLASASEHAEPSSPEPAYEPPPSKEPETAVMPEGVETPAEPNSVSPIESSSTVDAFEPAAGDSPFDNELTPDLPAPKASARPSFAAADPVFKWDEDAEDDETVAILKAELVELQAELAERDAQLEEFLANESSPSFAAESLDDAEDDTLIARVDDLLLELNESDERLSLLQTMLGAAETANRAEQEERKQLEAWVGDIEHRLGENEAVRDAEFSLLRNRLEEVTQERDKVEAQLASSAQSSGARQEHENLLKRLRDENTDLQEQLREAAAKCKSLEEELNSVELRNTQEGQQMVVDQAIREERAKIATQQAELARERAELAAKLADIERETGSDAASAKVDDRVKALRDHLKEIHQQEGGRPIAVNGDKGGLMSRIAGLWNKLDQ